jgi:hypothetical protein
VEARGIRRALERQADALELAQRASGDQRDPRADLPDYSRTKEDPRTGTWRRSPAWSMRDVDLMARALAAEGS